MSCVDSWRLGGKYELSVAVATLKACTQATVIAAPYNPSVQKVGAWGTAKLFPLGKASCGSLFWETGVWFIIKPRNGTSTVVTATASVPIQLQVFSGACTDLTCVIGADSTKTLTFVPDLPKGTEYYVMVGTASSLAGNFALNVTQIIPVPGCEEAIGPITVDYSRRAISGTTIGAPFLVEGVCRTNGPSMWYSFVSQQAGNLRISTCNAGTTLKSVLSLYYGTVCSNLKCYMGNQDDHNCKTVPDADTLVAKINANQPYYVSVSSENHVEGAFVLSYQMLQDSPY